MENLLDIIMDDERWNMSGEGALDVLFGLAAEHGIPMDGFTYLTNSGHRPSSAARLTMQSNWRRATVR